MGIGNEEEFGSNCGCWTSSQSAVFSACAWGQEPGAGGCCIESAKITEERVEVWAGKCRLRCAPAQYSHMLGSLGSCRFRRQEDLRTGSLLGAITLRWLLTECVDGFPRASLERGEGRGP